MILARDRAGGASRRLRGAAAREGHAGHVRDEAALRARGRARHRARADAGPCHHGGGAPPGLPAHVPRYAALHDRGAGALPVARLSPDRRRRWRPARASCTSASSRPADDGRGIEDQMLRLADGRALGFRVWGDADGRPLLFLHGTPGSRLKFAIGHDAGRALGLAIVAPDRWGYGLSDPHPRAVSGRLRRRHGDAHGSSGSSALRRRRHLGRRPLRGGGRGAAGAARRRARPDQPHGADRGRHLQALALPLPPPVVLRAFALARSHGGCVPLCSA